MANKTAIGWTDFSSNPLKYRDRETGAVVWACVRKSDGCTHCYSQELARRWNKGRPFTRPNIGLVEPFLDDKEIRRLLTDPKLTGKRVFLADMTDLFGDWVPDALLDRVFAVLAMREDVTWQLLTKRPERMLAYLASPDTKWNIEQAICGLGSDTGLCACSEDCELEGVEWPLPNVWLGTSCEDQRAADERIPHLLRTPAAVRFLSCEPLLGPIDLWRREFTRPCPTCNGSSATPPPAWGPWSGGPLPKASCENCADSPFDWGTTLGVDWAIVGGESGPRHRPMDLAWAESIVEQCRGAGVAVYLKQDSGLYPGKQGRFSDDLWALKQLPQPFTAVS